MAYYASSAQKMTIDRLLRKAELRTPTVCLVHRPVLERARLWSGTELDKRLDDVIGGLTAGEASRLINALQVHVGEGEGD